RRRRPRRACNHLLNAAARLALHEPFDRGGAAAQRGSPSGRAVESFAAALDTQRAAGRSLGSGDELAGMLRTHGEGLAPNDLLASVCAAVARVIAGAVREHAPDAVYLAGGSALNGALAAALRADLSPIPVEPLDALGVPAQRREAAAFAVLGALCADRTPITLPAITGCASLAPISGAWIDPRTP
ncbi:MAG: anhydro-N-acetylmuramic acid kinase, partial [Phycisphaerales bacterium]